MAKILVIGDVHQKVDRLKQALAYEHLADYTVFIGDYFDDFEDNVYEAMGMAWWLRDNLDQPNRVILLGNHDFQYMLPEYTVYCSGFTGYKHEAINKVLTPDDWKKFEYFHSHESDVNGDTINYWFSHAGITRLWFEHPVLGTTPDTINENISKVKTAVETRNREWDCVWAADRFRGGRHKKGGLLWNDWDNNDFFENTTQIVGHTPQRNIAVKKNSIINAQSINVDTHLREVILLDTSTNTFETLPVGN